MKNLILLMMSLVVGVTGNANAGIIHAGTPDADYRAYGNSSIFSSVVGVIGRNAAGALRRIGCDVG